MCITTPWLSATAKFLRSLQSLLNTITGICQTSCSREELLPLRQYLVVQRAAGEQRGVAPVEAHDPGRAVVPLQHAQAPPRRAARDLHSVVAAAPQTDCHPSAHMTLQIRC
jgi:hypothetical protein